MLRINKNWGVKTLTVLIRIESLGCDVLMYICLRKYICLFFIALSVTSRNLTFLLWSPRQQHPHPSALLHFSQLCHYSCLGDHTVNQAQADTWAKNSLSFGGAHPQHHKQLYQHNLGGRAATEQRPLGESCWRHALRLPACPPWCDPACPAPHAGWCQERLVPAAAPLERTNVHTGCAPRLPVWKTRVFLFSGIFLLTTLQ